MPYVVDASVAAGWCLPDERTGPLTRLLEMLRKDWAVVPALFWFEVRNVLLVNERRGRITVAETRDALDVLARLPVRPDAEPRWDEVLCLARRHRLTVYDAAYLELALRRALPLATLDRPLRTAAAAEGAGALPLG